MEIETGKKKNNRRIILYWGASLMAAFMIYYAIMSLLSPSSKIDEIQSEFGFKDQGDLKTDERIFSDSSYITVNREKAYYQARILMAESDSICLALNLSDSTAILEITGVMVHKAKISHISLSKVFRKADEYSVSAMLAMPFTISKDFATIRKEPVMLKMAPKDTSEYKPDILPDTTGSEAVNCMLEMANGTRLYLYQEVGNDEGGSLNLFLFDLNDRLRNIGDNLRSILRLKIPEYHPSIRIRLSKADARIIYRALPKNGQITVFR